jgi:hypothetical protein
MPGRGTSWTIEEDSVLDELAGIRTGKEIGEVLDRPIGSVFGRAHKLGISMRKAGELHHAAKVSNLQRQMIMALMDAGYEPKEIAAAFKEPLTISKSTIKDIEKG